MLAMFWRILFSCIACLPLVAQPRQWAVAIHGGAGPMTAANTTRAEVTARKAAIESALRAAAAVLDKGGRAIDAIEPALHILEDDPNFNAGRGAVFTAAGRNELDSSIMDGKTMQAGAVAGITRTRHPVSAARAVMEKSPHVMLIGEGADTFAKQVGLEQVAPSFFFTEPRWQDLVKQLTEKKLPVPARPAGAPPAPAKPRAAASWEANKLGTVGIVVRDRQGNVAAATSTGGMQGKQWGRVGDSPIIGAGTYASNTSCAVSSTGTGEFFIRYTVARDICALVEYKGMKLQAAADEVIQKRLVAAQGDGGVIAITPDGQIAWSFNTSGMFRGKLTEGGRPMVSVFKNEP
jgi:beta-aspartyl-peptidase (threonine type)